MRDLVDYSKTFPEKVFIIGSGASLDLLREDFFKDRFIIGVNKTFMRYDLNALIVHHHHDWVQKAISMGVSDVFVSKWDRCIIGSRRKEYIGHYYSYEHPDQGFFNTDFTPIISNILGGVKTNRLMIGGTTVVNAIGLAVRFGAKEIILCGCDGKIVDGKVNYEGYYKGQSTPTQAGHAQRSIGIVNDVINKLAMLDINVRHLEIK